MLLLLTNDDGIAAPGLEALARALAPVAECWVIAPAQEQSAGSHSLSLHRPLRVRPAGERRHSVDGSPADCVYMGLGGLCPRTPDAVVCGINHGGNLALDVYYSGTVAAAREAAMWGVPALSVSLLVDLPGAAVERHWAGAGAWARRVVETMLQRGLPPETLLNLNVPNLPPGEIRGLRSAALGRRTWSRVVDERRDLKGRPYCWIGGSHLGFEGGPETDGALAAQGWATLTPLQLDCTAGRALEGLARWPLVQAAPLPDEER
ncbi:MAG: 5'/3'-nucleotidase SurE [Pseudomonadota bacterium]